MKKIEVFFNYNLEYWQSIDLNITELF